MMKSLRLSFLAFLALWLSLRAFSQTTTGELAGRVTDATNQPIPGALVEVRSPVLIRPRQAGTNQDGQFRIQLLPPGLYEVMARMTGFNDAMEKDIRIPLGETVTLPMVLTVSSAAEVTVTSEVPLFDATNAKAGLAVSQRLLNNLPLGRNYAAVAYTVPGVGADILGPTFYGAPSLENSYGVDGMNTTSIVLGGQGKKLPLEFVQEVEVRSGGYEAEYGKALGGNINAITKAGGNDFHGNLFGYYDSEYLSSADQHQVDRDAVSIAFAVAEFEVPRQYDIGVSLGGPLIRDRLWFFGAYDRAQVDNDYDAIDHYVYTSEGLAGRVNEARTDRTATNLFALNLSWAPAPSHILTLSVFGDPSTHNGRPTSKVVAGPPSATVYERETGGTDVSAKWTGFLGRFIVEAQFGYHEENTREKPPNNAIAVQQWRDWAMEFTPDSGALGGTDFYGLLIDEAYRRNATQLSGSLTMGSHEIKVGGSYELENPNRTSWYNQGEAIFPSYSPDGGTVLGVWHQYLAAFPLNCKQLWDGQQGDFGPVPWYDCSLFEPTSAVRSDFRTRNASAFLQDTWRPLSNLTIKAGLRYDFQEFVHTNGNVALKLNDQWSPRLSVAWDFGGMGRTKLFASYGRYYQAIPLQFQALMMSNEYRIFAWNLSPGPDLVALGGAVNFGVYVPEGRALLPGGTNPLQAAAPQHHSDP